MDGAHAFRRFIVLTSIALLPAIAILGLTHIPTAFISTSPTPFTATLMSRTFDSQGKLKTTQVYRVAERADGSRAEVRDLLNQESVGTRVVVDMDSRTRTAIDPITESKTTYQLRPDEIEFRKRVHGGFCASQEPRKRRVILGHEAYLVTTNRKSVQSDGSSVLTRVDSWHAPGLGCFVMAKSAYMIIGGVVVSKTDAEVTSITLGEPDPGLFKVPNYTERRPSEVFAELGKRRNAASADSPQCARTGDKLDEVYLRAQ